MLIASCKLDWNFQIKTKHTFIYERQNAKSLLVIIRVAWNNLIH